MATSSPDSSGNEEADDDLDAVYAAAVIDNPAYPYDSEEEQQVARAVRNARYERRSFGQLLNLAVPDTLDEPLPDTEVTLWEDES
ncbi:hypothetical protein MOKP125_02570 [Mycobacterium avium subsp. hominissuis]